MNVTITSVAKEKLEELYQEGTDGQLARINIAGYGWAGPTFEVVLSEPGENDIELDIEGMKILVEENMADIFTGFTIDYIDSFFRKGFVVSPIR